MSCSTSSHGGGKYSACKKRQTSAILVVIHWADCHIFICYLFLKRKCFRIVLINLFELAMQSHSNSAFETRIFKVFFFGYCSPFSFILYIVHIQYPDTFRDSVAILDSAVPPYNTITM